MSETPAVETKRVKEKKNATREVAFQLSDAEIVLKAREASELRIVSASLEAEFTRVKSTYKGRLEEKKNQISALLDIIREGKEKRIAEVVDTYDYEHALVETHYNDALVEQRVMTAEERQIGLFPGMEHKRASKKDAQGELPLKGEAQVNVEDPLENLPPYVLPEPGHKGEEETVTNESLKKNKAVEFHGTSWLLEPGEMSIFHVVEEEVFGQMVLVWAQRSSNKLAPPKMEETAQA